MANRVEFQPGAVRNFVTREGLKLVRTCTFQVNKQAKRNAPGGPYSTGRLKRSINYRIQTAGWVVRGISGSDLIYANSVHQGSPARKITAKRAPHLKFYWRRVGKVVTPVSVNHPGTTAQPYLTDALLSVAPRYGFRVTIYR